MSIDHLRNLLSPVVALTVVVVIDIAIEIGIEEFEELLSRSSARYLG